MNVPECCHDGATILSPSDISFLPYGHKVEIMMNYTLTIKNAVMNLWFS